MRLRSRRPPRALSHGLRRLYKFVKAADQPCAIGWLSDMENLGSAIKDGVVGGATSLWHAIFG